MARRVEYGDWQTPLPLAREVAELVSKRIRAPKTVVEPTCGRGAFLRAAADRWPDASLVGYELDPAYVEEAAAALGTRAEVRQADFFSVAWRRTLAALEGPLLLLGNPPWVTTATLGALDSKNLPPKAGIAGRAGLDSLTGASNFDVSESMLRSLIEALDGQAFALAMLIKTSVARRLVQHLGAQARPLAGELHHIDAKLHFGASVDASLMFVRHAADGNSCRWPVFESLHAPAASRVLGLVRGTLTNDVHGFERTRPFEGQPEPAWRSGVKHDCSRVMELRATPEGWASTAESTVQLEDEHVYPLLKGSDVANGRLTPRRAVVVPQKALAESTATLEHTAPRTWAYLSRHRQALDARKSRIYRNRPPFSIFGIGPYTFAPFKVAIAGLYRRLAFQLVEPSDGKPIVLDDTCYFLPFEERAAAVQALTLLRSPAATEFFEARVFWDAKRPITKSLLSTLDLARLPRP